VVADIGSGLVDATCPWLAGGPPAWLANEPAARQTIEAGAALVTFSCDKLFGGPQAGVVAGNADLVARCARHPLARALRPGGLVLDALQAITLSYLRRDVTTTVPFWRMATIPVAALHARAAAVVSDGGLGAVEEMIAVPGAGSLPGVGLPSVGVVVPGDHLVALRSAHPAIVARVREQRTFLDLRAVDPADDILLVAALRALR
ncbi:MAG TPA: hypothetical protein VIT64_10475, partial [Ilumatobacteraceae bacterium]